MYFDTLCKQKQRRWGGNFRIRVQRNSRIVKNNFLGGVRLKNMGSLVSLKLLVTLKAQIQLTLYFTHGQKRFKTRLVFNGRTSLNHFIAK